MSPIKTPLSPILRCDLTRVSALVATHHNAGQLVFDPAIMVAEAQAYRAFHAAAQAPAATSDFDWEWLLMEGYGEGRLADLLPELEGFPEWAGEHVSEYFIELARAQSPVAAEDASEEAWEELYAFMRAPTQAVADTNPILRHVPNAVAQMQAIDAERRHLLATKVCKRGEPVALRAPVREAGAGTKARELWIWLAPDNNNIDDEAPDIFLLCASLIERKGAKSGEIIATLYGEYIPLLRGGDYLHPGDLFEIMDAHTQKLNDVWKDLHGVLLPRLKHKSLHQLADDFEGMAFCCPWIEVDEPYRGQGVTAELLRAVATTCEAASIYSALPPLDPDEALLECRGDLDGDLEEEEGDGDAPCNMIALLEENPIRLYVIQVEGSRPEQATRNLLARGDVRKSTEKRDYNSAVERRRIALERYFQRINDPDATGFHIHTYNPWDYPFT